MHDYTHRHGDTDTDADTRREPSHTHINTVRTNWGYFLIYFVTENHFGKQVKVFREIGRNH